MVTGECRRRGGKGQGPPPPGPLCHRSGEWLEARRRCSEEPGSRDAAAWGVGDGGYCREESGGAQASLAYIGWINGSAFFNSLIRNLAARSNVGCFHGWSYVRTGERGAMLREYSMV